MIDLRPYVDADAAACCEVIIAAVPDMDGLNEAARAMVRAKNVPALEDALSGSAAHGTLIR